MASVCPYFSMVAWKETQPDTVVMARLRCKSWQCPHCAKENRKIWRKHLLKTLPRIASDWWFITLTAHEKIRDGEASLNNIRSNLDKLFKRVKRVWTQVEYVRVYEPHKNGAYHTHLLCSGLSSGVQKFEGRNRVYRYRPVIWRKEKNILSVRTWWRRTARSLGMGYMVDVQPLQGSTEAIRYVTKYLTKDVQGFAVKNLRKVQTSRRIGSPRNSGDGTWITAARVFRQNVPEGARLYDADKRVWIPKHFWETRIAYPEPNSSQ